MLTGKFHDAFVYDRRMMRLTELLTDFLSDSKEILDVGCGDGKIDAMILEKMEVNITGVDVLIRDTTYIPVIRYDGIHIPDGGKPDTIMTVDVLHHTDDPAALVREMVRCTGKYIVIKDHYKHGFMSYLKLRAMDYVGNAHYKVRLPYNYLSPTQWDKIFSDNGLKVVKKVESLGLYKGLFHLLFDRNLHFIVKLEKIKPNVLS